MADHSKTVGSLIRAAESAAAATKEGDLVANLVALLQSIIRSEADPYLLAGVLAEIIAAIVAQRVPVKRQAEVSRQMVRVLRDRLRAHGLAPPDL
jgi:hypothetical protein